MCGIAGILTADAGRIDVPPALAAMTRALRHRGPDDTGRWQSPSGAAAFTHTRLSVFDPSPAGRQPMSTPDGRYTITFNGAIYNFHEVRRQLEQSGVAFQTRTDTEVILRAYQRHGDACLDLLRGMFAFALWDEQEQACLLARDRFGIKPLYYHHAAGRQLVFGSEVRALQASGLVSKELDSQAVYQYFRSGSVPEPRTLLRDVRSLEAGQLGRWQSGRFDVRRYWSLGFPEATTPREAAADATRAALLDSVQHHFAGDVPVGVFLSGGIDSTALVALARAAGQQDLRTFSMSLPGSAGDEGQAAHRVAAHFGTHHQDWPVDAATAKGMLPRFLQAADQPSIDGLNTFVLAGFAHERGLKVALSGLGADEMFGGYRSFVDVPRLARWDTHLGRTGPLRPALGRMAESLAPGPRVRRIGDMLGQPPGLAAAYTTFRGVFTRAESRRLTRQYAGDLAGESGDDVRHAVAPGDEAAVNAVSVLELTRYVRNQLLRESDLMSMAWGLELRTPYIDAGVFDAVSRVPAGVRIGPGKRLLLDAIPEIPRWVALQPKLCFQFPFAQWLEGEWRDVFADVTRTAPVPTETWYRKWSVYMFERWLERAAAIGGGSHR